MTFPASNVFSSPVGRGIRASELSPEDYLIQATRFPSEGNWAFCRFSNPALPAARLGFQRGGFNGGWTPRRPSPQYLQLHLELITSEGALLWLPSGRYSANDVRTSTRTLDIVLAHGDTEIFSMRGWPKIQSRFRSDDWDLQADLEFDIRAVTVLPDCKLPKCLFGMWESMGEVRGVARYQGRTFDADGKVFFDHTRVLARPHTVPMRHRYVYTTLYLEDGCGIFGYYSEDQQGNPIPDYCFGVYLDEAGESAFAGHASLANLKLDADSIASAWRMSWRGGNVSIDGDISVQPSRILRSWGTPSAPQTRAEFSIIPLVLEANLEVTTEAGRRNVRGHGLAEYFNADLWPADAAAATSDAGLTEAREPK